MDSFFICQYVFSKAPDYIFKIKNSWLEYVWKNKLEHGEKVKGKLENTQLILELDDFNNPSFTDANYIVNWEMEDPKNGKVGTSNGVYVLSLNNNNVPDSFNIEIGKIRNDRSTYKVYQFSGYKR